MAKDSEPLEGDFCAMQGSMSPNLQNIIPPLSFVQNSNAAVQGALAGSCGAGTLSQGKSQQDFPRSMEVSWLMCASQCCMLAPQR